MNLIQSFAAYAAAFEKAFESDDWSEVEAHLTEDAEYETLAPEPFGGIVRGRDAVLAQFKASLDGLDRRFDERHLEALEGPEIRDDAVWMRWKVTYRRADTPDLLLEGEERATFEGDRIRRLEDRIPDAVAKAAADFLARHGAALGRPGA